MIPKFRAWHNELGRMMSISDMWFNVDSLGEIGLNDAVMNDYITVSPDEIELMQSTMDVRQEKFEIHNKKVNVDPDVIGDFRDMPFEDNTFNLVVFDPPHLKWAGPNSIMKAQYGQLDKVTWSEDLAKGFEECMRVLKVGGTLVFKWSDCQINVKEVLKAIPFKPLFGQQRGTTHWMTFMKFEEVPE